MIKSFVANIYFLKEEEGGRKTNIRSKDLSFGSILNYNFSYYHCRLDFGQTQDISLGPKYKMVIRVEDRCPITIGSEFEPRELKTIGEGIILDCLE